uniref:metal ABC transporter substrate-binding protein n=1 Tax=uncultured Tyzzerella sp. TaxID=2321398 RepID=UPI002943E7EB
EHEHEHQHEDEIDEHVWTSPINAIKISKKIKDILVEKDSKNAVLYEDNTNEYIRKLEKLDKDIRDVVSSSKRNILVFGDRFPFRYLANEYNLDYFAAFSGCSTETEASPSTVAFLVDKVKEKEIPVVFTIEFSNGKIADAITDSTGAKKVMLHSCHNVSADEFANGVTYLSLMNENINKLREALN